MFFYFFCLRSWKEVSKGQIIWSRPPLLSHGNPIHAPFPAVPRRSRRGLHPRASTRYLSSTLPSDSHQIFLVNGVSVFTHRPNSPESLEGGAGRYHVEPFLRDTTQKGTNGLTRGSELLMRELATGVKVRHSSV